MIVESLRSAKSSEYTRKRAPLDWAMTQMNLGNALWRLGERESGTARLEEAVSAYRAALEELIRAPVPLQWAMTQTNLALVYLALFDKSGEPRPLEEALEGVGGALQKFHNAKADFYIEHVERPCVTILAAKGEL